MYLDDVRRGLEALVNMMVMVIASCVLSRREGEKGGRGVGEREGKGIETWVGWGGGRRKGG